MKIQKHVLTTDFVLQNINKSISIGRYSWDATILDIQHHDSSYGDDVFSVLILNDPNKDQEWPVHFSCMDLNKELVRYITRFIRYYPTLTRKGKVYSYDISLFAQHSDVVT